MDPNAHLAEMRAIAVKVSKSEANSDDADRFAELFISLDEWLRGGGQVPRAWNAHDERKLGATLRAALVNDRKRVPMTQVSHHHARFRDLIDRLITL